MGSTPWPQRQRHKSEILNARRYQRTTADRFTSQVHFHNDAYLAWQTWRLISVKVEGTITPSPSELFGLGSLPPYDGDAAGQSSTHARHAESEHDEFGTIVNEVTIVTTHSTSTVTTRKRYRVEDA